ncbi:hypothetical protein O4H49_04285 [Kiloniella laminariae]|uniref:Uncharacterized protein n=1 Tax=Kiloniella laminariae TaxID=454162 RepID=A0ABT4LFU8_9PROT|nr:hypothetical protein [Kiloniella laminariae]MCZ4279983.1 hypothetical protein [Kiloniella laminariae]
MSGLMTAGLLGMKVPAVSAAETLPEFTEAVAYQCAFYNLDDLETDAGSCRDFFLQARVIIDPLFGVFDPAVYKDLAGKLGLNERVASSLLFFSTPEGRERQQQRWNDSAAQSMLQQLVLLAEVRKADWPEITGFAELRRKISDGEANRFHKDYINLFKELEVIGQKELSANPVMASALYSVLGADALTIYNTSQGRQLEAARYYGKAAEAVAGISDYHRYLFMRREAYAHVVYGIRAQDYEEVKTGSDAYNTLSLRLILQGVADEGSYWPETMMGYAYVQSILAAMTGDPSYYAEALEAYQEVVAASSPENHLPENHLPENHLYDWAAAQFAMAGIEYNLAELTGINRHLVASVARYQDVMTALPNSSWFWKDALRGQIKGLNLLMAVENNSDYLEEALVAFELLDSLVIDDEDIYSKIYWAEGKDGHGSILHRLGVAKKKTDYLRQALRIKADAYQFYLDNPDISKSIAASSNFDPEKPGYEEQLGLIQKDIARIQSDLKNLEQGN